MNDKKEVNEVAVDYLKIYREAHNNAVALLGDAEMLFEKKSYSSAYALAYTALEEISKSQFAADIATGFRNKDDFKSFYRDHVEKISGVKWAHLDANSPIYNMKWIGPDKDDLELIESDEPTFTKRNLALYVDVNFNNGDIKIPKENITEEDAKGLIHIVNTAIYRIIEVEHLTDRIGTKGFMK
jgi:AbiV family abortive infection protein